MLINPKLPDHFFYKPNDERSKKELKTFWQVPFILTDEFWSEPWTEYQERTKGPKNKFTIETETEFNEWTQKKKESWFKEFPSGLAFNVFCLDGGAWDRPTEWGSFATLEEAKQCCWTGPSWRKEKEQKPS
jgi:hypothetical protein